MSNNLTLGPVQVLSLDLPSLNYALLEVQNRIDALKGLRGETILNDKLRLHQTPVQDLDVATPLITPVYATTPRGVPPLQQVEEAIDDAVTALHPLNAPPLVGNLSLIGVQLTRYAAEDHTHQGVNLTTAQTILGVKQLGNVGQNTGRLDVAGVTSGVVSLSVADAAGTITFKLPTTMGSSGQALLTDGISQTSWGLPAGVVPTTRTLTIAGTANQISVSPSGAQDLSADRSWTLALTGPYTPATYTAHGVLVGEGTSSIVALAVGSTGQVLKGSTGADPAWGTLAASELSNGVTGSGAVVLATTPTLITPHLGTPASGTLTNCTGLPVATGISGLGSDVATFLATPSSANLAAALTDEFGSGSVVFSIGAGLSSVTPFSLRDTSAAFNVTLTPTSSPALTAGRTLTLDMGNVAHTLALGTTANTITFPNTASDTVAMLAVSNAFTALQDITVPSTGPTLTLHVTDSATTVGAGATFTMFEMDPTNNNRSAFSMSFVNSGGVTAEAIVRISAQRTDNTIGAQTGNLGISTRRAGTVALRVQIENGVLVYNAGTAPTGGDMGAGTLNTAVGYYLAGQDVALFPTGTEMALGDVGNTTRIRASLATPGSLADGDWWVDASGTSPTRIAALKLRDGGVTRTIASVTY